MATSKTKVTETPEFFYDVRCTTCRRKVGVSLGRKWGTFCDQFCAQDIPAVEEEARDAIIESQMRDGDTPLAQIGAMYGFSRQRMYQLRDSRDLRKQD